MSKTRQKTHSEKEHLSGRIKKLERENRRLRKENRMLSKRAHMYENVIDKASEHDEHEEKETCKQCGKGQIEVFDFTHIIVKTCNVCEHQWRYKPKRK